MSSFDEMWNEIIVPLATAIVERIYIIHGTALDFRWVLIWTVKIQTNGKLGISTKDRENWIKDETHEEKKLLAWSNQWMTAFM